MNQTIQGLYENFIKKSGASLDAPAPSIFAFSCDDILVIANSNRVMRNLFEIEKASVFANYRQHPEMAKTRNYKFFDNTDEDRTFFAKQKIGDEFKFAMGMDEDYVQDFDSDFSMGGASFIIFAKNAEKLTSFPTKIRDLHMIECEISTDEKKSTIVPGFNVRVCSTEGKINLKKDGEFRTKQDLDNMPQILEKAITGSTSKEREI